MSKIRILYVQETVGRGGVERRKLSVAKLLDKQKYEIKLVCTIANSGIAKEFEEQGVEVIRIGKFKNILHFAQYNKLLSIIRAYRPHIIHGAVFEGVTLACVSGKIGRVPIIIAEETSDPQNRSRKASFLLKLLVSAADKVVAIAPAVGDYLKNVARIPSDKICVINNGVEVPRIVPIEEQVALRAHYHIGEDELVIGSVGRLQDNHKRFSDIIRAVGFLPTNHSVKILIVGGGKDEELLKAVAEENGLSAKLILAGHQADTAPFYAIMDIFCLASQREGFGLVAAEAMLHSLPVVASKVGGLQNIVLNEETGYLVQPLKPQELAAKLALLIDEPGKRVAMGTLGFQRAMKEYTAKVYVAKINELYQQLLKEKGFI